MPGMKGDEFLILVHEHYPELTKIMLTGHADPEAVERTKQLTNLSGCVNKPWTQADFYSVLPPEQEET